MHFWRVPDARIPNPSTIQSESVLGGTCDRRLLPRSKEHRNSVDSQESLTKKVRCCVFLSVACGAQRNKDTVEGQANHFDERQLWISVILLGLRAFYKIFSHELSAKVSEDHRHHENHELVLLPRVLHETDFESIFSTDKQSIIRSRRRLHRVYL